MGSSQENFFLFFWLAKEMSEAFWCAHVCVNPKIYCLIEKSKTRLSVRFFIYFWLCWVFRFCARAFSSCDEWGPLFIAVRGPLTIAASLVAEHRLQTRRLQTHRLSNCGSWASLLRGMWDLPRPGLEPVPPALAGRLSTTAPPGIPSSLFLFELGI